MFVSDKIMFSVALVGLFGFFCFFCFFWRGGGGGVVCLLAKFLNMLQIDCYKRYREGPGW